jgi:redox-sensing transcriptional repressor
MVATPEMTLKNIPTPSLSRLCLIYDLCEDLTLEGIEAVSSSDLAKRLGVAAHNIRKDICYLGEVGTTGAGYNVTALRNHIGTHLMLGQERRACVVGLGRLGTAILEYPRLFTRGYKIIAGFESSTNRLETIHTSIKVYPSYEMTDIVRREGIEIGILAVPATAAQSTADDLIAGGVKGILNFSPTVISSDKYGIIIRNIDLINELRIVSTQIQLTGAQPVQG